MMGIVKIEQNGKDYFFIGHYEPWTELSPGGTHYTMHTFKPVKAFETYEEAAEELYYLNGGEREIISGSSIEEINQTL